MTHIVTSNGETATSAGNVSHPPCPACGEGVLLPMNVLAFWVCTTPSCTYTISCQGAEAVYYKGHALTQTKEKDGKRWVEFRF